MKQLILIIIVLFYLAVIGLHLYADWTRKRILRSIFKILLMPTLCVLYLLLSDHRNPWVLSALFLCTLGDAFLVFPERNALFFVGSSCFGAAHILYCIGMASDGLLIRRLPFGLLFFIAWIVLVLYVLLPNVPKNMRFPLLAYAALLGATAAITLIRLLAEGTPYRLLSFIGGLLFLFSDSLLLLEKYRKTTRIGGLVVMATYILAQTGLVLGFALQGGI